MTDDDEDECPHGLGDPSFCSLCKAKTAPRRVMPPGMLHSRQLPRGVFKMEAAFDSRCPGCGGQITAGDMIFKMTRDDAFECEGCAIEDLRYRVVRG